MPCVFDAVAALILMLMPALPLRLLHCFSPLLLCRQRVADITLSTLRHFRYDADAMPRRCLILLLASVTHAAAI